MDSPSVKVLADRKTTFKLYANPAIKENALMFVDTGNKPQYFETRGRNGTIENHGEGQIVMNMINRVRGFYHLDLKEKRPFTLRVITFYTGQVSLIQRLVSSNRQYQNLNREKNIDSSNIIVSTVDSAQGCEADIVIISFVRSGGAGGGGYRSRTGFLKDFRRLNVGLTRAKSKLICVGDLRTIESGGSADGQGNHLFEMVNDVRERDKEESGVIFNPRNWIV